MKLSFPKQVKPGEYEGKFVGLSETSHPEYGAGVRFDFRIDKTGAVVSRTTQRAPTLTNTCGRFLEYVSGLPLSDAVEGDTDDWIGAQGIIVVEASPAGESVRVTNFIRRNM